ncbi:nicotinamide N-methyltransferase-like [Eleutherodactylus coqui]|uniref:nicotinamide N-methyltransferase-like n=1 Tax=Eleutherodactylus coqui TaxID=57060 RepID=UPI003461AC8D
MDSGFRYIYNFDENDTKILLKGFYSPNCPYTCYKESTINVMISIYKAFDTGIVNGRSVCDFSFGPIIGPLISINDFVEEITFLQSSDASLKELEKWMNKDSDAFDWSSAKHFYKVLKGNSDESEDVEESLRGKTKIVKWDLRNDNYDSKVDIVTCVWGLETYSKNHDDYRGNVRKLAHLIRLKGYFMIYSVLNATQFIIGEDKFHFLSCNESFCCKVLSEEGFDIKHCEKFDREMVTDATDHQGVMFIIAQKMREP